VFENSRFLPVKVRESEHALGGFFFFRDFDIGAAYQPSPVTMRRKLAIRRYSRVILPKTFATSSIRSHLWCHFYAKWHSPQPAFLT